VHCAVKVKTSVINKPTNIRTNQQTRVITIPPVGGKSSLESNNHKQIKLYRYVKEMSKNSDDKMQNNKYNGTK